MIRSAVTVRRSLAVVFVAVVSAGCSVDGERAGSPASTGPASTSPSTNPSTEPRSVAVAERSPLGDRVIELGNAAYDAREHRSRASSPLSVRIDAIGLDPARVVAVGVTPDGALAVPADTDVGWYRYGAAPTQAGSVVLAAHVAFDGVDGAFRHLGKLQPGDVVVVTLDDGTERVYRVDELAAYRKDALPAKVWARDGAERLVLITCGGRFDAARRSYDDNVVAWASPRKET
jgi:LPXTG-site transpeptidase (sortase) family protein